MCHTHICLSPQSSCWALLLLYTTIRKIYLSIFPNQNFSIIPANFSLIHFGVYLTFLSGIFQSLLNTLSYLWLVVVLPGDPVNRCLTLLTLNSSPFIRFLTFLDVRNIKYLHGTDAYKRCFWKFYKLMFTCYKRIWASTVCCAAIISTWNPVASLFSVPLDVSDESPKLVLTNCIAWNLDNLSTVTWKTFWQSWLLKCVI